MESKIKFGLSSSEFKQNEGKTEEFNKKALWVNICLMTVAGLQISIYYTSIWPYLKEVILSWRYTFEELTIKYVWKWILLW